MTKTSEITRARLREVLDYGPEAGIFRWKMRLSDNTHVGDVAGSMSSRGYIQIRIDGVLYSAHRLAYLYVHGYLPKEVDHRNTVRSDNRIDNLRASTRSQNTANSGVRSDNTSGYKGVSKDKRSGKWWAHIKVNGKHFSLGRFTDIKDAAVAYRSAAVHHFGEFARFETASA
jgi:hypothetical protein